MKVKYVGPSPSVMAAREGYVLMFEHGVPTEVDDEWGASLCEQDTFHEVKSKPEPKSKSQVKSKADPAATEAQEAD